MALNFFYEKLNQIVLKYIKKSKFLLAILGILSLILPLIITFFIHYNLAQFDFKRLQRHGVVFNLAASVDLLQRQLGQSSDIHLDKHVSTLSLIAYHEFRRLSHAVTAFDLAEHERFAILSGDTIAALKGLLARSDDAMFFTDTALSNHRAQLLALITDLSALIAKDLESWIDLETPEFEASFIRPRLVIWLAFVLAALSALGGMIWITYSRGRAQDIAAQALVLGMIEQNRDAVLLIDRSGAITQCNAAARVMFAHEKVPQNVMQIWPLLAVDEPRYVFERLRALSLEGQRTPQRKPSGSIAFFSFDAPVGAAWGMVQVRAENDQVARPTPERLELLNLVSHEMRTPLSSLLLAADLLRATHMTQRQQDLLNVLAACGQSAVDQLNNILDLSRLRGGGIKSYPVVPFLPSGLIAGLQSQMTPIALQKGLRFEADLATDIPFVLGQKSLFLSIASNLIGNALKFTEQGFVRVKLKADVTGQGSAKKVLLTLCVIDTGVGIKIQDQARVFDYFNTSDTVLSSFHAGTGLGLGIVQEAAAAMGGQITMQSAQDAGSSFTFTVSLTGAPDPGPKDAEGWLDLAHCLRLLIVEDNLVTLKLMVALLTKAGHRVTAASTGQEAMDAAKIQTFDVILMDLSMPALNGVQVCQAIRKNGLNKSTPMIAVTGHSHSALERQFLRLIGGVVLLKPVKKAEFLMAISSAVGPRLEAALQETMRTQKKSALPREGAESDLLDYGFFHEVKTQVGPDAIGNLIALYLKKTQNAQEKLKAFVAQENWPEAAYWAHYIGGGGATLGLYVLHQALIDFETQLVQTGSKADAAELCGQWAELDLLIDRSNQALQRAQGSL